MKVIAVLLMIGMLFCIWSCKAAPMESASTDSTPTGSAPTEEPSEEPSEEPTEEITEATQPISPESNADPATYVSQLLTDINYNGKIQPGADVAAPGTLPEISQIPVAEQTLIGTTIKINLGAGQEQGSYLYRVDSQNNRELLAVVIHATPKKANNGFYIPLLAVFQVELGGLKGLCNAISTEESFSATVLSLTNISFEEGVYTQSSTITTDVPAEEVIDLTVGADAAPNGWYIGNYGNEGSTDCHGGSKDTVSQQTSNDFAVFERIFTRFSIEF